MKRFIVLMAFLAGMASAYGQPRPAPTPVVPSPQVLASKIVEVTVFTDRALVTRRAELELAAGERTLVFSDLPAYIDPASVQVSGKGSFMLRDVRVAARQLVRDVSEQANRLQDRKWALEETLVEKNDRIREAEAERAFVSDIAKKITAASDQEAAPILEPDKWMKMVDFYRARLAAIDADIRTSRKDIVNIQAELSKVGRELQDLGSQGAKSVNEVEASFDVTTAGRVEVNLSYIVFGSSWRPDYSLRASSSTARVSLHYQALVRQNTGEDWSDVSLRLSTAKPQVGGSMPVLSPWILDLYRAEPRYAERRKADEEMLAKPSAAPMGGAVKEKDAREDMAYAQATPDAGATAVSFALAGKAAVASDNKDRKLTIVVLDLPAKYSYAAVPKLAPYAFFKATITNASDYPFLAGTSHVFVDGGYVADASIDRVPPGGEFDADLGIDEGIAVERVLKKKFDETAGIISKKSKTTYQYEITVKNGKATPVTIKVSDQLPMPANEAIVVKTLAPQYSKDTETLKKGDFETFTWTLVLAPKEETRLPLSFSVEYPKGTPITGLE
ncbi:MAG: mucoidy inhibitor MuiA family protein [Spirochaetes bacterium]|nr:mucoidy inhibitor MuiA family protein [Spirochaetota bacterium]